MFKEIGQVMGLMKSLPKIKEEMERLQQRLVQITAEGDAGAGMVKVRVNGKQEIIAVILSDEAMKTGDRELLGEMVRGAVNQALERVRKLVAEETSKMATNLGLPPGMAIPGMPTPGA
jgi:DNA-binding YbaB/EbfC family protein